MSLVSALDLLCGNYSNHVGSITSVGGTTGVNPETAASLSSGGFSNIFSRPSYQTSAVSSYLTALGSTNSGLYNTTGRAFPDMAALATDYVIAWQGDFWLVDGTSCSTPLFASLVSLLNDELVAAGKSPLGFLNPLIYSSSGAFTDITSGTLCFQYHEPLSGDTMRYR